MKTVFALLFVLSRLATAQLTTLVTFDVTHGVNPTSLVEGSDGNFYGTTFGGGTGPGCNSQSISPYGGCGTVFKVTPDGKLTTLHSFNVRDGAFPLGALVQGADGNFYGTTSYGGSYSCTSTCGYGTVLKLSPTGTFSTLWTFSGKDGNVPIAGLVQGTDGNFYGTTFFGGSWQKGNVFQITAGGALISIYSFVGGTSGLNPAANLIQHSKRTADVLVLMGGTNDGGTRGSGILYSVTSTGTFTNLHQFDKTDGDLPCGALLQTRATTQYGITNGGGANDNGTVYTMLNGAVTTLYSFGGASHTATANCDQLVVKSDVLYGIDYQGGVNNEGMIFSIELSNSSFTDLADFDGSNGKYPYTMIRSADGKTLYGVTFAGNTYGTIFKFVL
jgi:uncharacterized repeat protein (TIGR03803 family)